MDDELYKKIFDTYTDLIKKAYSYYDKTVLENTECSDWENIKKIMGCYTDKDNEYAITFNGETIFSFFSKEECDERYNLIANDLKSKGYKKEIKNLKIVEI